MCSTWTIYMFLINISHRMKCVAIHSNRYAIQYHDLSLIIYGSNQITLCYRTSFLFLIIYLPFVLFHSFMVYFSFFFSSSFVSYHISSLYHFVRYFLPAAQEKTTLKLMVSFDEIWTVNNSNQKLSTPSVALRHTFNLINVSFSRKLFAKFYSRIGEKNFISFSVINHFFPC